jgi:hypothetical protein
MAIGTYAEKSLHAALKEHFAQPGDTLECALDGYVIDILRPADDERHQCIEIQTRNLAQMKPKLLRLLEHYPVRVLHPIAYERTITRVDADGVIGSRRKSPRRGTVYHVFPELLSLPTVLLHPNFALEVVLIREEQVWLDDGKGSWRRKHWSIHDRKLLDVVETVPLNNLEAFAALLPAALPPEFDVSELAKAIKQQKVLARKMAYCLRTLGVIELVGQRGKAYVYKRSG